jgi:putative flippase GtrA
MVRLKNFLGRPRNLTNQDQIKIRFLLVGALNTVVGLTVFPALYFLVIPLQIHYLLILVISQIMCVSFSFMTSKFLVFRTSGNYLRESAKFITFHLTLFLLNLAALPVLIEFAGIHPIWAQMLFTVLVIVSSYFWHSYITFSSSDMEKKLKLTIDTPKRVEK